LEGGSDDDEQCLWVFVEIKGLKNVDDLIALSLFSLEAFKKIRLAAARLAKWVVKVVMYHTFFMRVSPLLEKVQEAQAHLPKDVQAQIATLQEQIVERVRPHDDAAWQP
jgi:hypothetical protein